MIKTKKDFKTSQEYLHYTRSMEFLEGYCFKNKTANKIYLDMGLYEDWIPYIEKAIPILIEQNKFLGLDMLELVDYFVAMDDDVNKLTSEEIKKLEERF